MESKFMRCGWTKQCRQGAGRQWLVLCQARPLTLGVMAGHVPAIYVFRCREPVKSWMAGTRPAMTSCGKPNGRHQWRRELPGHRQARGAEVAFDETVLRNIEFSR
jgi:hypothetical protein